MAGTRERLGHLVVALADGLEDVLGRRRFRDIPTAAKKGGVEGDKTFYFGEHAEKMKGPQDIDLDVQPPPDLAIEVEVSHSADDAVIVWGRLGVPEVWRFDPIADGMLLLVSPSGTALTTASNAAWPSRCSPPTTWSSRCDWRMNLGMGEWYSAARPMGPQGDRSQEAERRLMHESTPDAGIGFYPPVGTTSSTAWARTCARRVKSELEPGERLLWAGRLGSSGAVGGRGVFRLVGDLRSS